jgi:hypothetical protein
MFVPGAGLSDGPVDQDDNYDHRQRRQQGPVQHSIELLFRARAVLLSYQHAYGHQCNADRHRGIAADIAHIHCGDRTPGLGGNQGCRDNSVTQKLGKTLGWFLPFGGPTIGRVLQGGPTWLRHQPLS